MLRGERWYEGWKRNAPTGNGHRGGGAYERREGGGEGVSTCRSLIALVISSFDLLPRMHPFQDKYRRSGGEKPKREGGGVHLLLAFESFDQTMYHSCIPCETEYTNKGSTVSTSHQSHQQHLGARNVF